jgi:REP element-mobilizing transposase RayT
MTRVDREDAPDTVWHVSARVNWQVFHLVSEQAYRVFIDCFGRSIERFAMDLISFVLMSNHFHSALKSPPEATYRRLTGRRTTCRHFRPYPRGHPKATVIGQCLRYLKLAMSKRMQASLGLKGHFWDGKHFRRRVHDAADLVRAVAYDHRNPVRQAMVARPADYPRSSAAWWEGSGDASLPICRRPDPPFGVSLEVLRRELLRFQREKRLDDVMEVFQKTGLTLETAAGRAKLDALMRDAGLVPAWV